ncbi:helix-hairpin-helix domain-containing protein [Streptomyces olivoreticuli]|uniref:helix-hairpin-helix domain-containing protein n=1 Tax=Streptomyces olivoreticuli TaxID=68246 RepID=UPI001F082C85|nr:helix-hairpin-helix domain-containing protein [Streptomyces olivoreticuli]
MSTDPRPASPDPQGEEPLGSRGTPSPDAAPADAGSVDAASGDAVAEDTASTDAAQEAEATGEGEAATAEAPTESSGSVSGSGSGSGSGETQGGPAADPGKRSAVAEALAAAVRAVESGERSAASYFTEPSRPAPAARKPAVPAAGASAAGPAVARTAVAAPRRPLSDAALAEGLGGVREVLAAGGAPEQLAAQAIDALGEQAAAALREDPWQLLAVQGVRPEQADGFARALLGAECGPGDERRAVALTVWLLERAALEGHTVLEATTLREALSRHAVPDPDEALQSAIAEGAVLVFQEALETPATGARGAGAGTAEDGEEPETPVRVLLGLDRCAMAEESLADGLTRLISTFGPRSGPEGAGAEEEPVQAEDEGGSESLTDDTAPPADPAAAARRWEALADAASSADASASAKELIRAVAGAGLVTHSGGEAARAEVVALVGAARAVGLRAWAAVHAESGKQRAHGPDEAAAVTVAGLLSGLEGPGRDADGSLALDVLAVLDAPQLDVETAAVLVESLADGTRLVLSGDPGVLWSAGPGRVFADVVAAQACPAVVSRTPDPGPIGELVSGIGIGELNQVAAPGKEVVIVPVRDPGEAVHRTVQLVADSVPRAIGVPAEQTQVITPGHGGPAGTRALNAALKERLNPGPGRFGGFDPGDRVAYVPAPGRMLPGTVVSADAEGLRLDCAGTPVVVPKELVGQAVRHGWAVTAHQAVGARWPAAVVVLPGDAARTLTRSWVYTAFGRAERHLSVVQGVDQALPRAVAEVPAKERTTRLKSLLRAQNQPA